MTKKKFLNLLEEALEADENSLTCEDELDGSPLWDSLAIVVFIAMVDENFDVTLSPGNIAEAKTVQDLVDMLGDKIQS